MHHGHGTPTRLVHGEHQHGMDLGGQDMAWTWGTDMPWARGTLACPTCGTGDGHTWDRSVTGGALSGQGDVGADGCPSAPALMGALIQIGAPVSHCYWVSGCRWVLLLLTGGWA